MFWAVLSLISGSILEGLHENVASYVRTCDMIGIFLDAYDRDHGIMEGSQALRACDPAREVFGGPGVSWFARAYLMVFAFRPFASRARWLFGRHSSPTEVVFDVRWADPCAECRAGAVADAAAQGPGDLPDELQAEP